MLNGSFATRALALALASCAVATTLQAATIQVPADHASIQQAINAAVDGDVVLIAPGSYNEAIDFLGKAITVTSASGAAKTAIDASDIDASVVKFVNGEGPQSILSGLTVIGGTGTVGNHQIRYGGGIYVVNGNPSIINCVITGNTADTGGGIQCSGGNLQLIGCMFISNFAGSGGGGGIQADNNSQLLLEFCTFENNCSVYSGGGVYASQSSVTVDGCALTANKSHFECKSADEFAPVSLAPSGGGIFCEGGTSTISNSTFTANEAYWAGGGFGSIGSANFNNCVFENNVTELVGGAIGTFSGNTVMNDCIVKGNSAGYAGGLFNGGSNNVMLHATNCQFENNTATDVSGGAGGAVAYNAIDNTEFINCNFLNNAAPIGGAVSTGGFSEKPTNQPFYLNCTFTGNIASGSTVPFNFRGGGAVYIQTGVSPLFVNCLFTSNSASLGYGGAFVIGGEDFGKFGSPTTPSLINCTLTANSSPNGGAIFTGYNSSPTVVNSIIWNNGVQPIVDNATSTTTVTFSDVQYGYPGQGNIDVDPLFFSTMNFMLLQNSPCIDSGNNAALPPLVTADLAGNPRIQNKIVDMGAYEVLGPCAADIVPPGGDGKIGVDELLMVINNWGSCPNGECPPDIAPPGGNGVVNVDDLLLVINQWGVCE